MVSFEGEDLVLDAEFLSLQVADRIVVRRGAACLSEDGLLKARVPGTKRLESIL
jgi:hypothetical protein